MVFFVSFLSLSSQSKAEPLSASVAISPHSPTSATAELAISARALKGPNASESCGSPRSTGAAEPAATAVRRAHAPSGCEAASEEKSESAGCGCAERSSAEAANAKPSIAVLPLTMRGQSEGG